MSDSEEEEEVQKTEEEVREEIEKACMEAFNNFDKEGTFEISSGDV